MPLSKSRRILKLDKEELETVKRHAGAQKTLSFRSGSKDAELKGQIGELHLFYLRQRKLEEYSEHRLLQEFLHTEAKREAWGDGGQDLPDVSVDAKANSAGSCLWYIKEYKTKPQMRAGLYVCFSVDIENGQSTYAGYISAVDVLAHGKRHVFDSGRNIKYAVHFEHLTHTILRPDEFDGLALEYELEYKQFVEEQND